MKKKIKIRRIWRKLKFQIRVFLGKDVKPNIQLNIPIERYGSEYGGWYICPDNIHSNAIIYSFGVGEDASFDMALIRKFGVDIYAFDPTPRSIEFVKKQNFTTKFKMHSYGVASFDGNVSFNPPEDISHVSYTILDKPTKDKSITVSVFQLATIMKKLGHKYIDLLKMDIEGAEYEVIDDIINNNIPIKQLLIEFHHVFPNVGLSKTKDSISKLNLAGYKIFAISDSGQEYSFIKD